MLIGACNPISCPLRVSWLGLDPFKAEPGLSASVASNKGKRKAADGPAGPAERAGQRMMVGWRWLGVWVLAPPRARGMIVQAVRALDSPRIVTCYKSARAKVTPCR